jgi:hypothetical protein
MPFLERISLLVIIANEAAIDEVGASSDIRSASSFGLSANSDLLIGVLMAPGAILFTVIPAGPSSTARSRISIRIAPLLAQ